MKRNIKKLLLLVWCFVLIYGTLLPFNFKIPVNFNLFNILSFLSTSIKISKSDFVFNILIFIPFGYLFSMVNKDKIGNQTRLFLALVFINILFSFLLELSQVFLPTRSAAVSDIIAQIVGGIIGYILFIKYDEILSQFFTIKLLTSNKIKVLIYIYSMVLLVYGILPGDISISPVFIYHKWKKGLVKFIPFYHDSLAIILHNFSSQFILYIPLGLLLSLYYRKFPKNIIILRSVLFSGLISLFIEFMQLFANYHVTDIGEVLASICGAGFSSYIYISQAKFLQKYINIFIICLFIIIYGFYPYTFSIKLVEKFATISFIPLSIYCNMPFFLAIESIVHKLLFFAILGFCIAFYNKNNSIKKLCFLAILFSMIISILLMIGQLFIKSRIFDVSDPIIAILGAAIGVLIYEVFIFSSTDQKLVYNCVF